MRSSPRRVVSLVVSAMLGVVAPARAVGVAGPVRPLLDVPYVSQTPELCGGAAVSMVMRYWGERGVFAQDFAPLVGAGTGGILTGSLASAVRDRGWQALVVPVAGVVSARAQIRTQLDSGRPLIALVEVGPLTYHYVVIVGGTDRDVVLHDPAQSPFRVLSWDEFDRAWMATGRWMMLVLPPAGRRGETTDAESAATLPVAPVEGHQTPCRALVERGVRLSLARDVEGAEQGLVAATGLCPDDSASWRELAGWRFSQARWPEAQSLALTAVHLAPEDAHAWQLVATSRYLMDDLMGALDAWNQVGEPRIDSIDILTVDRTPHPLVVRASGLHPRQVLTPETFGRALRRLRDVPIASTAQLRYEPIEGGLVGIGVSIGERRALLRGKKALATLGARALLLHELRADFGGPVGAGELWSAAWRWSANRPRVVLGLALPSPRWLPGVISIDGLWERQSYDISPTANDATLVREGRRRGGMHLADWATSWLKWQVGGSLDRLREHDDLAQGLFAPRDYLAVESAFDVRLAGDRFASLASASWWTPFAGGNGFGAGGLLAAWRSSADPTQPSWSVVSEIRGASRAAPLALWQGAGTGNGRNGLLRAHPLLDSGIVTGEVFGRRVVGGSFEYAQPVARTPAGTVSIAGFVDTARAWHRLSGLVTSPLLVDTGVGVRVNAPGLGAIRLDVAHGLRGGGTTLSAGWGGAWPR